MAVRFFRFILILFVFIPQLTWAAGKGIAQPAASAETSKPAKSATFYLDKGKLELERSQHSLAARSLSMALRQDPDSAEAYRLRGIALERLGVFQKAEKDFTRYIELKPRDAEGHILRGDARTFNMEHSAALDDYNAALKLSPRSVPAYLGRGLALVALERYDEAIKDYQWVLTMDPNNTEAAENMALACMLAGRALEAVSYFEKALKTERDPAWRAKIEKWIEQVVNDPGHKGRKAEGTPQRPAGPTAHPLW
jgi:tetratricopeptide (TPR) repeat protein